MNANNYTKAWGRLREIIESTDTIPQKEAIIILKLMIKIKKKDNAHNEKVWNTLRKTIEDTDIIPQVQAVTVLKLMVEIEKHYHIR